MTQPYDPRYSDDLPRWGLARWLLTVLAVGGALFWVWLGIHVYVAVFG